VSWTARYPKNRATHVKIGSMPVVCLKYVHPSVLAVLREILNPVFSGSTRAIPQVVLCVGRISYISAHIIISL